MGFGLRPWLDGLCFLTDSGRGLASYGLWVKALVGWSLFFNGFR